MTLKLEVGKRYVRGDGFVTGHMVFDTKHPYGRTNPFRDPISRWTYREDGRYLIEGASWLEDLVAEYVEPSEQPANARATEAKSIAQEAEAIVNGARRSTYGEAEDNFERIARFWNAYFKNTGRNVEVTAADVSPMMRLLKEARLCETPTHRDSFVDLIGYTLTGARVNKVE